MHDVLLLLVERIGVFEFEVRSLRTTTLVPASRVARP